MTETADAGPIPTPAAIARDPVGTRAELRVLRDRLAGLRERVRTVDWDRRKTALLLQTAEGDFWDRPDRFVVLSEAETMDRVEAKIQSAASLLDRLFALARDEDARLQRDPVARLARELLQLDLAIAALAEDGAQDAMLLIEADEGGEELARDLQAMYEAWARSAGATCQVVDRGGEGFRRVLADRGPWRSPGPGGGDRHSRPRARRQPRRPARRHGARGGRAVERHAG